MAIDFDAIKRKLERLSGANKNRNSTWKPTEGEEHTVRLISFPDNDGQPFKEIQWYYNIPGSRGMVAPYQFGKKDPVQELIGKLREEGSKESYEMAKKLYPNMRTYAAVVVRGQEDEGVKIWGFGKTVYQKLLSIMLDEDYGDITDPLEGRDIKVVCTKPPGKKYAMTDVMPRGKSTKLSSNSKQSKEWLENIPSVDDLYTLKTYDDISSILEKWINGDDESVESEGTEHPTSTIEDSSSSKGSGKTKNFESLDDAFADLMD
jgi:hypothetical protein